MKQLFIEGGLPMWLILLLGLIALGAGAAYAARPHPARERFVARMGVATALATAVGLASALGATFHHVAEPDDMTHELRVRLAMLGVGESMAPLLVGGGMLTVVALLCAVGRARFDARRGE